MVPSAGVYALIEPRTATLTAHEDLVLTITFVFPPKTENGVLINNTNMALMQSRIFVIADTDGDVPVRFPPFSLDRLRPLSA